jgi:predicted amidophosphoribosyltransferase
MGQYMNKHCSNCRAGVSEGANHCPNCGQHISKEEQPKDISSQQGEPPSSSVQQTGSTQPPAPSGGSKSDSRLDRVGGWQ